MNKQTVEIDHQLYEVEIDGEEIQSIERAKSYRDTASGELQRELDGIGTTAPFGVHVPEEKLKKALHLIGEKMMTSDLEIVRVEESGLADDGTYIEWEQESARGLYDTPEEEKSDDMFVAEGTRARRGL